MSRAYNNLKKIEFIPFISSGREFFNGCHGR